MWIRSQSKVSLMDINWFKEVHEGSHYTVYGSNSSQVVQSIGTYSTEEKALKVLDMIEETMKGTEKIISQPIAKELINDYAVVMAKNLVATFERKFPIVFDMPQDEEIK